ncbi:MAG: peptidoglycan DD-metalloendopeptidase family protein [Clostridium sp.]|nr:peptidoglycan DD-metalloendopeptidase family protein [Clostridium sp.]
MRKFGIHRILCLFLALLLMTMPAYGATKKEVEEEKSKAQVIAAEKQKTEQKIAELEALKGDTQAYIRELDMQLLQLADELDQLETDIAAKQAEVDETTAHLAEAEQTEREQYEAMKLRIQYMYEKGDSSYLDMLLSSGSMSELLNRAEYIQEISVYDRDMLEKYKAIVADIAATKVKLEEELQQLEDLKTQTEAKQQSVLMLVDEKNKELANLNSQLETQAELRAGYEADLAETNARIAQMEEEIRKAEEEARRRAEEEARRKAEEEARRKAEEAARAREGAGEASGQAVDAPKDTEKKSSSSSSSGSKATGSLSWPLPASDYVTSGFGHRESPTAGASSNHQGIDIGASTGSSITAADGGTVITASYSSSAGNYVVISHGNGLSTVYMHCSKLLVSEGDTVSQGQTIAKVGSTGYSTGPHLHFGVRKNGSYVDPTDYVSP